MGWTGPSPRPTPRASTARERVLARVRHPSFSPEMAGELLDGLGRRQLHRLWADTGAELGRPLPLATRCAVVALRDHVLRRLDEVDPAAVRRYLRGGRAPLVSRLRVFRS